MSVNWRSIERGLLAVCFVVSVLSIFRALGASAALQYHIKKADVAVPSGVPQGAYARTIRPFENWTLICDENLAKQTKVCNITQVIEDQSGKLAFSWSLAATDKGQPFLLLRTSADAMPGGFVSLQFPGLEKGVDVEVKNCNLDVCVGMVEVGATLKDQIAKGALARVSYATTGGATINVSAPLKGLAAALRALH